MIINTIPTVTATTNVLADAAMSEEGDFAATMSGLLTKLATGVSDGDNSSQPQTDKDQEDEITAVNLPAAINVDTLVERGDAAVLAANVSNIEASVVHRVSKFVAEKAGTPQSTINTSAATVPVIDALVSHGLSQTSSQIQEAKATLGQEQDNRFMLVADKPRGEVPQDADILPSSLSDREKPPVAQTVVGELSRPVSNTASLAEPTAVFATANPDTTLAKPVVIPTAVVTLPQQTGTTEWQQSLGQQLACFTRDGIHHAELRLHPEELGAVQISLRMSNERMQIHFMAENPQARSALENALPSLRHSLAESGINLGQSSVSADANSSSNSFFEKERSGTGRVDLESGEETLEDAEEQHIISSPRLYSNGINTFV
ncbi:MULTISPECIES: flagellar hook-length control protein FliK [Yersinia]|uniref:Flagellar hook-length control protein n=1 Tax=Yersinia frederiksenii TaxID=29484 RepID=A0AAI9EPR8_YERFR|nr:MULTISPECIES: flagellar hook-length control protein FliK [Yersinia]MDN0127552.1 flagellar hook-length control protein FliK [Yersinia massiliensis]CFR03032.1 flagellar hook-length control protein [Yersinia frederiksenii]